MKKLSHIGIAVENLTDAVEAFSKVLGGSPDSYEEIVDQKVRTAIFDCRDIRVELLEGTAPDSPITKFIEKRGPGIHHMAVQVDNIIEESKRLNDSGMKLIDESPRAGAEGSMIAFIHPKSTAGILIELQEKGKRVE